MMLATGLLAVLALIACTQQPAPVTNADRIWQTYGEVLALVDDTYSGAMLATGSAHARGVLTDDQVAEIAKVGRQVKAALDTAQDALLVYPAATDPQPQEVALAVAAAQRALLDLLARLAELGVKL